MLSGIMVGLLSSRYKRFERYMLIKDTKPHAFASFCFVIGFTPIQLPELIAPVSDQARR
jgi:hypothetical protein